MPGIRRGESRDSRAATGPDPAKGPSREARARAAIAVAVGVIDELLGPLAVPAIDVAHGPDPARRIGNECLEQRTPAPGEPLPAEADQSQRNPLAGRWMAVAAQRGRGNDPRSTHAARRRRSGALEERSSGPRGFARAIQLSVPAVNVACLRINSLARFSRQGARLPAGGGGVEWGRGLVGGVRHISPTRKRGQLVAVPRLRFGLVFGRG
jgi:hypothetical protein